MLSGVKTFGILYRSTSIPKRWTAKVKCFCIGYIDPLTRWLQVKVTPLKGQRLSRNSVSVHATCIVVDPAGAQPATQVAVAPPATVLQWPSMSGATPPFETEQAKWPVSVSFTNRTDHVTSQPRR